MVYSQLYELTGCLYDSGKQGNAILKNLEPPYGEQKR